MTQSNSARPMPADSHNFLEVLEDRIAPASATFIDVDGDHVKVTTSKGKDLALQGLVDAAVGGNSQTPSQMNTLDFTASSAFAGTDIRIAVIEKAAQGDGLVNVWAINATNMDLGKVVVKGDLAGLLAGDNKYMNILAGYTATGSTIGLSPNEGGGNSTAPGHWADGANVGLSKPAGGKIESTIAKIVIQGLASSTIPSGIVAQKIQSLTLGGVAASTATGQPGPGTGFLVQDLA